MSISKERISSPLEAGRSILDTHNLPPQLTSALEYTSKRLARKGRHITLIVVKNEYQLPNARPWCPTPTTASPPQTPEYSSSTPSGFASPSSTSSRFTSPVVGLRQLVRKGTNGSLSSTSSHSSASTSSSSAASETSRGRAMSLVFPPPLKESASSPRRWILPLTPASPFPSTPLTPATPSSITTMTTTTSTCAATSRPFQTSDHSFGIRLIHALPISLKDEKLVQATITKTERRFHMRPGSLPAVMTASACGLSTDLVRRSIQQNELLFSSEGLTLLGLDRLYSFKAALSAYGKTIASFNARKQNPIRSPGLSNHPVIMTSTTTTTPIPTPGDSERLEDAVDCLRRLVLSNGDRPIPKAYIHRNFDWMGVNQTALGDVERMYRRAYGGPERRGPFEAPPPTPQKQEPEPASHEVDVKQCKAGFVKINAAPSPKNQQTTPVLKLNTNITSTQQPQRPHIIRPKPKALPQLPAGATERRTNKTDEVRIEIDSSNIVDGDDTPHPLLRDGPVRPPLFWSHNGEALGTTIDEMMLSPCDNNNPRQSNERLGPMTPNGYDDISPITRGEWGFLFKGDTWTQGRTVAVETF